MKCLSDSLIRARIDEELTREERLEADRHLGSCDACRARLESLAAEAQHIERALSALAPGDAGQKDPRAAFAAFRAKHEGMESSQRLGALSRLFAAHPLPAWGGAAIAGLIVVMIAFAPARSLGQRVLAMLRVERVAVVPVSLSAMPGRNSMETVSRLLSDQVMVTLSPGKPQTATTPSQAAQLAGFHVRTLTGQSQPPRIAVEGERAFVMTLNRGRLQQVLSALGRPDLQLPASIDGSTIAVHIPKSVFVEYGNCPRHTVHAGPQQAPVADATGCTRLGEVPSPVVSVPPGLDINQLAEVALEAAGMTPEEAEAFCQTIDWTSTLVVPIPSGATTSMQVSVDGAEGTLITGHPHNGRPAQYDLLWVKNGIIYSIWGYGNAESALGLAGSLS